MKLDMAKFRVIIGPANFSVTTRFKVQEWQPARYLHKSCAIRPANK